jgi:hypothetical protein
VCTFALDITITVRARVLAVLSNSAFSTGLLMITVADEPSNCKQRSVLFATAGGKWVDTWVCAWTC